LIKSLEELFALKDSTGNIRDIEDADIQRVLRANFGSEWRNVYDGWKSKFTVGMAGIDNFKDSLDNINDLRKEYLPGKTFGKDYKMFLINEFPSVYEVYRKHLLGKVIDISKVVAT
ncbi:hypothetical protein LCGC14_2404760, partial [marine sediment metagenome]